MKKNVIFVGFVRQGRPPVDGETTKNQHIIGVLRRYCRMTVLDFYQKHRHPWVYVQALWALLTKPQATIIFSTSAKNVYGILKLFKAMRLRRDIIHWVVGGNFGQLLLQGRFRADVFGDYVKYNLVQCKGMIAELEAAGVTNVKFVSNFKNITYYPDMEKALAARRTHQQQHFVFLSRIMASKGCDFLLEAVRLLNAKGYEQLFRVDFYGKIDPDYCNKFLSGVQSLANVSHKGLLDLSKQDGYDTLASYDAMIFPTIHSSEGFSGVFIDAFVSALPVLTSNWAYNAEIIIDGINGLVFPAADTYALATAMENCITGKVNLQQLARQARTEAGKYAAAADSEHPSSALSEDFLRNIGLLPAKHKT